MFFRIAILLGVLQVSLACDVLGATGCPKEPESALKTDDFIEYCEMYKAHLECVFEMYEGCDRKGKYAMAMTSMVKGLYRKIRKMQKLCERDFAIPIPEIINGIEQSTTRRPKRRKISTTSTTTTSTTETTATTTTMSTTTTEPCEIDSIATDCHPILTNIQFMDSWPEKFKKQWCNSARPYFNCIKMRIYNCEDQARYTESFEYYKKIKNYVEDESNKNCPGGLEGCVINPDHQRCRTGPKFKNMIGLNSANSMISTNVVSLSIIGFLICRILKI